MGSKFETTPERCFGNEIQSIWGSCKIFKRKMIDLLDHFAEDFTERLFIFVMLTKCCIFAIKNGIVTSLSKLCISSVSGEYRNFLLRKLWVFEFLL